MLPNPLTLPNGHLAQTTDEWRSLCRPRIAALIQREEYGLIPPAPTSFVAKVVSVDGEAFGGTATLYEIDIVTKSPESRLELLLAVPNNQPPAGCFLGLNFSGNHAVLVDPLVRPPYVKRQSGADVDAERGRESERWPVAAIVAHGYALATLHNGDVIPDNPELAEQRLAEFGPRAAGDDSGAIACWAWSLSRVVDYLAQSSLIDATRIAVVGHSRNGKAALLAAALDERIAMAIINQSGTGGLGPSRDIGVGWDKRETVARINEAFPHWFCGNFKAYNDDPEKLPFDQHFVASLCAPRPLLLSSAVDDLWANPPGSLAMLRAADTVYRLLTQQGCDLYGEPVIGKLTPSPLGHFIRTGGHSVTAQDWAAWLDYADRWL